MTPRVLRWWPVLPAVAILIAVAGRRPAAELRPLTAPRRSVETAPILPDVPRPEAVPPTSKVARRPEPGFGLKAVDTAPGRGEKIGRLKDVLRSGSLPMKSRMIPYLRALGGEEAVELAAELLRGDGPSWLRARAAGVLGELGLASAFPALLDASRSEDLVVRAGAAAALDRLGQPAPLWELIGTLSERLDHPDVGKRGEAVDLLTSLPARAALPVLAKALTDPADSRLREAAADALGQGRQAEAVPHLERALQDPEPRVRRAAERALESIQPR